MKNALKSNLFILLFILLLPGNPGRVFAGGMSSSSFRVPSYSMNGGGNTPARTVSGSGSFILGSSVAQGLPIGEATSPSYQNGGGFWYHLTTIGPDSDGDGIPDGDGTSPCTGGNTTNCDDNCPNDINPDQADTDSDGIGNTCDDDDDNDGLLDIYETNTDIYVSPTDTGTDPLNSDSDGDGYGDGDETALLSDPNNPLSVPEYGTGDIAPHGAPDGVVDVADAMLAMRIVTGLVAPTQLDLARGDVAPLSTPDGAMDIADALLIMRKATGLVSF